MRKILLILTFLAVGSTIARAQLDIKVAAAEMQCTNSGYGEISVTFDKSLSGVLLDAQQKVDKAGSQDTKDFYGRKLLEIEQMIVDLSPGNGNLMTSMFLLGYDGTKYRITATKAIAVRNPSTRPGTPGAYNVDDVLTYRTAGAFSPGTAKYLFVMTTAAKSASMTPLAVSANCVTAGPTKLPSPSYQPEYEPGNPFNETVAATAVKDEAVVYADLGWESRKRNNELDKNTHFFSGSLSFVPWRIKKLGFAGNYEIQPFFYELKVNDKGSENSYISRMGGRIRYIRVFADDGRGFNNDRKNRFLPGLAVDLTGGLEMNDFFDGINVIGEIKPILPINVFQSRARMLRLDPFVGFTFGRRVKESSRSEQQLPRGSLSRLLWLSRPMAGFDFTYSEFRDRVIKPTLTLGYTVRWPLHPEDIYGKSLDGNNTDIYLGRSELPRRYFNAKLSFDMGTIVTPFVSYEDGRLPPDYKLINGQVKVGFAVKFKAK